MLQINIGGHFLKDTCYSQQIISAVAKKSLICYNLTQITPEKTEPLILQLPPQTKSNKCKIQFSFSERQLLFHTNINNKNKFKLLYKKQCLQNELYCDNDNIKNIFPPTPKRHNDVIQFKLAI